MAVVPAVTFNRRLAFLFLQLGSYTTFDTDSNLAIASDVDRGLIAEKKIVGNATVDMEPVAISKDTFDLDSSFPHRLEDATFQCQPTPKIRQKTIVKSVDCSRQVSSWSRCSGELRRLSGYKSLSSKNLSLPERRRRLAKVEDFAELNMACFICEIRLRSSVERLPAEVATHRLILGIRLCGAWCHRLPWIQILCANK